MGRRWCCCLLCLWLRCSNQIGLTEDKVEQTCCQSNVSEEPPCTLWNSASGILVSIQHQPHIGTEHNDAAFHNKYLRV